MKIMTILGTRPEMIRLSLIIKQLDNEVKHLLVHTGQNYADSLNAIFFRELGIRKPDFDFGIKAETFGEQVGRIIAESERVMLSEKPDRVLILGDTNSGLAAFPAKRLGIPVYHLEAGNRCYDDRVPEEVNRRVIDHSSDFLLPYTHRSKENLLREGIDRTRIFVIGNPIYEVIQHFSPSVDSSDVLSRLRLKKKEYCLVTMHRAENVDLEPRLRNLTTALNRISAELGIPVICSLHPRTRSKMEKFGLSAAEGKTTYLEPLGFFDFVALERDAKCVITDSGTVQEECCIMGVPNITIRDVTERPETIECGSNVLTGDDPERIVRLVNLVTAQPVDWDPPREYLEENVSNTVVKILLGYEDRTARHN